MKSEKGITLISLIVYIIVMLIVVTIIGTISSYFYSSVNNEYIESQNINTKTNLELYLTKDLKNKEIELTDINSNELIINSEEAQAETIITAIKLNYNEISPIVYTITNDGIYRDAVKIYSKENNNMHFELWETAVEDKVELRIIETINEAQSVFVSYIVNIK